MDDLEFEHTSCFTYIYIYIYVYIYIYGDDIVPVLSSGLKKL